MTLKDAWNEYVRMNKESDILYNKGKALQKKCFPAETAKEDKLRAECDMRFAEGKKICAEADLLASQGELIFINAVIENLGENVKIKWDRTGCIVGDEKFTK